MIYLDSTATSSVDPEIAKIAYDQMLHNYGNPSSLHHFGMDAYQTLMNARYQIARSICAPTSQIFFTSGGTESNNLVIQGICSANPELGNHIVTTSIEHSSILSSCEFMECKGYQVTYVKPDARTHRIVAQDIIDAVTDQTVLVSVMHVNNETGEIISMKEIADGIHQKNPNTLIHSDCVQSFGKLPTELFSLGVDLMSASSHKIHGPKGTGMLYVKEGCKISPLKYGGSQEGKINPGTENVPSICAFGAAAEKRLLHLKENLEHSISLNQYLRKEVTRLFPEAQILSPSDGIPYILNFALPGQSSADIVDSLGMYDIYVSSGSACSKGAPSHVLISSGYPDEIVSSALRISFCEDNTTEELDIFLHTLKKILS